MPGPVGNGDGAPAGESHRSAVIKGTLTSCENQPNSGDRVSVLSYSVPLKSAFCREEDTSKRNADISEGQRDIVFSQT